MGQTFSILNSGNAYKVQAAQVDAGRTVQAAYNEKEAASSSLARFAQSLSNQRKLDAAGAEFNARTQNINAALDAATTGTFNQRIAAAAELGAATVMAGAAGVGGGSVETYRRTLNLSNAIREEGQDRALANNTINATAAKSQVIGEAVAALDNNSYMPNFDYTVYSDPTKQSNVLGALIAANAGTVFSVAKSAFSMLQSVPGLSAADSASTTNVAQGLRATGNTTSSGFWGGESSQGYSSYNIK